MESTKLILIADDDTDDLELLGEALLQLEPDATIHTVSTGHEILEYLTTCHGEDLPSLIILDYNMPDMTGAKVVRPCAAIKNTKTFRH